MTIAAVVGNADLLVSAAVGRAALKVATELGLEVDVTHSPAAQVEESLRVKAAKYRLSRER